MTRAPQLKDVTERIVKSYLDEGAVNLGVQLPSRAAVETILTMIEELCFPGFARDEHLCRENIEYVTGSRIALLAARIGEQAKKGFVAEGRADGPLDDDAEAFAYAFLDAVPAIRAALLMDVAALHDGDPAVKSREEVILAYPGLRAILGHRVAHFFWKNGQRLIARMMSEHVHGATGIDIHPGATIGQHFYIDHGTGVVVGETTVIGDHVKIYQGVSLGALSVSRRLASTKRHPTIEDHVTIYAGATILGGETTVGHHSVVGGNVWLVKSVPPYSIVENDPNIKIGSKSERKAAKG
jgi:serine O-acetyltransferase